MKQTISGQNLHTSKDNKGILGTAPHKFDDLDEIDQLIPQRTLSQFTQYEIDNLNSLTTIEKSNL